MTVSRHVLSTSLVIYILYADPLYRGAHESLALLERKQATATKDFNIHISYLLS